MLGVVANITYIKPAKWYDQGPTRYGFKGLCKAAVKAKKHLLTQNQLLGT